MPKGEVSRVLIGEGAKCQSKGRLSCESFYRSYSSSCESYASGKRSHGIPREEERMAAESSNASFLQCGGACAWHSSRGGGRRHDRGLVFTATTHTASARAGLQSHVRTVVQKPGRDRPALLQDVWGRHQADDGPRSRREVACHAIFSL
jgi:hypothetical protein